MDEVTLNNGVKMPVLGLGTYTLTDPDICEQVVLEAIRQGYRLIDTAQIYNNEKYIGKAVNGCGLPREELFLTDKLWPSSYKGERPQKELKHMLKRLGTDYIDLLLINQQVGDWKNAWKQMEKMLDDGYVRAIGVSNFHTPESISVFDSFANVPPAVDQVECHPLHVRGDLAHYLDFVGIRLEAWFPLGHGNPILIEKPLLTELSQKYRKSVQQVILRWHIQSGHIAIPRSSCPRHIKADINVFNFELSDEDMKRIDGLDVGDSIRNRKKLIGLLSSSRSGRVNE